MSSQGIAISQFADLCNIARPTVSQLLNGRNKKVSNEIITKIHSAFPALSISWLLFNEGNMLVTQDESLKNGDFPELSENPEFLDDCISGLENRNLEKSNKTDNLRGVGDTSSNDTSFFSGNAEIEKEIIKMKNNSRMYGDSSVTPRKVVNIIIFYSDNSFEYFKPESK